MDVNQELNICRHTAYLVFYHVREERRFCKESEYESLKNKYGDIDITIQNGNKLVLKKKYELR